MSVWGATAVSATEGAGECVGGYCCFSNRGGLVSVWGATAVSATEGGW